MKKSIGIILMMFLFGGLIVSLEGAVAGDGEALFKSKCGSCHTSGAEAPVFSPVKFASSQWERFFKRDKHNRWRDTSGTISPDEMEAVKQYLMAHAADSDLPIAAGLK